MTIADVKKLAKILYRETSIIAEGDVPLLIEVIMKELVKR